MVLKTPAKCHHLVHALDHPEHLSESLVLTGHPPRYFDHTNMLGLGDRRTESIRGAEEVDSFVEVRQRVLVWNGEVDFRPSLKEDGA